MCFGIPFIQPFILVLDVDFVVSCCDRCDDTAGGVVGDLDGHAEDGVVVDAIEQINLAAALL